MNPGRELDALVAEKVMGLKKGVIADQGYSLVVWDGKLLPAYSTDITAAWEVVTVLKNKSLFVRINTFFSKLDNTDTHEVMIQTINEDGPHWDSDGESVPHAICLAALKAVGIDLEESERAKS